MPTQTNPFVQNPGAKPIPLPTGQQPQVNRFGALTSLLPKTATPTNTQTSLGVRAASPTQNVKTPSTTLTSAQTAAVQPVTPQNNTSTSLNGLKSSLLGAQSTLSSLGASPQNGAQQPTYALGNGQGSIIPQSPSPIQVPNTQPIVGNTQTPNGATVNTTTGQLVTPAASTPTSLPGLLNSIQGYAGQQAATAQTAEQIGQDYGKKISDVGQQGALAQEALQTSGGPSAPLLGNALAQAQLAAARTQSLGTAENAALSGVQTGQQGLQNASNTLQGVAGLAPSALQYGAFGSNSLSPDSLVPSLAQQVQQGLIDPTTAAGIASSIYGDSGSAMLNQALQGGGYNYIQGQANAASTAANLQQTQSQGQQTNQAVSYASNLLDDLSQAYSGLSGLQTTNIPIINQAASAISGATNIGGTAAATQAFQSSYNEAVAAITQALASGGISVNQAGSIASSLLPPNPSPSQISAARQYLQTFLQQRQQTYTTPPQAVQYGGGTGTSGSGGLYDF